jgi:hypothetical protein
LHCWSYSMYFHNIERFCTLSYCTPQNLSLVHVLLFALPQGSASQSFESPYLARLVTRATCHTSTAGYNEMSSSTLNDVEHFAKRFSALCDFSHTAILPKREFMPQKGKSGTRSSYRSTRSYSTTLNFVWYTFLRVLLFWNYCHRTMRPKLEIVLQRRD